MAFGGGDEREVFCEGLRAARAAKLCLPPADMRQPPKAAEAEPEAAEAEPVKAAQADAELTTPAQPAPEQPQPKRVRPGGARTTPPSDTP